MARLKYALLLFLAGSPGPAAGSAVEQWRPQMEEASRRFGVPVDWIRRVMRAESGGRVTLAGRPIRSRAGAMGLMQIMPATWGALRLRYGLGEKPDDPRDNIMGGTAYLREMYDRFGYPGLFAAYNAGPARYAHYLAGKRRLPVETVAYLGMTAGQLAAAPMNAPVAAVQRLFLLHAAHPDPDVDRETSDRLFAIRTQTERAERRQPGPAGP